MEAGLRAGEVSAANKCDRCATFFEHEFGIVVLDVAVGAEDGTLNNWSDVDLCKPCGKEVLAVIAVALEGLDQKLVP